MGWKSIRRWEQIVGVLAGRLLSCMSSCRRMNYECNGIHKVLSIEFDFG